MYLRGEYRHKLDAKGRLSLPAPFRKALTKNLVVTISPDEDCLMVFEDEGFESWVDSLFERDGEGYKANNPEHAAQRKKLNSRAKDVELDNSGRLGIPIDLREAGSLEKEVVLIGDADHFEVWDAKRWDAYSDAVDLKTLFSK